MENNGHLHIRVPEKWKEKVLRRLKKSGTPLSWLVRVLVDDWLHKQEEGKSNEL